MKFIIEPSNGSWVAIRSELREEDLVQRLSNADILVSDLDDTDAPSPAKSIARNGFMTPSYLVDPKFWLWILGTEYHLARKGKGVESYRWKIFVKRFLENPRELARLRERYTPESVVQKLYPGVREFYALLPPWAIKFYLTRNVREVGEAYRRAVGFDELLFNQFDKQEGIQRVVRAHPERKIFIIKGDSAEDEAMLEFLTWLKRRGEIEDVTSIHVTNSPHKLNPKFDANIPRDYRGLVQLVRTY